MKNWIRINDTVRVAFFSDGKGEKAGLFVEHPSLKNGEPCEGTLLLRRSEYEPGRPVWTLVRENPMTLSPSVWCHLCGWHHRIEDGRVL